MPKKGYADVVQKDPMSEDQKHAFYEKMVKARQAAQAKRESDPTKAMPEEERIGRGSRKLEESDRGSLRLQVQQDEDALRASEQIKDAKVDVGAIKQRLDRNKMILSHDEDLTPKSGTEKDRIYARLKEITSTLQKNMPTKREMWPKTGSVEAQQAVRHNVQFQERYAALCHEYQELKKRLEPDDPYAHSLELIRPD